MGRLVPFKQLQPHQIVARHSAGMRECLLIRDPENPAVFEALARPPAALLRIERDSIQ